LASPDPLGRDSGSAIITVMILSVPDEARWIRSEPRRSLDASVLERVVRTAFPHCRVAQLRPLTDGFRNANFKVQLDTGGLVVVRIYEHDASLCQKEVDLFSLVAGSVPVPRVIHAEPGGLENLPPFVLMRYVEGVTFRSLKRSRDKEAIAQASFSVGETLAAIGRFRFPRSGWLAPGPIVTKPLLEGPEAMPRFVDQCLASTNLKLRMPAELRDRTHAFVWSWAARLAEFDSHASLVHGDFGKRNLLVSCVDGKWSVAAVLDWEFAVSSSPLADLGHFLRYESHTHPFAEPHFSDGYLHAGGVLPHDWRRLARLVDLTALCESLTHEQLPDPVVAELVELVRATVENRDPQL
jgi:aminoglycoside phosphotransferase (APT) family kinase protein